jgi:hypothetical protein
LRYFKFEELDYPQPLIRTQTAEVYPTPCEVMINVATLFTSSSAVVKFYERSGPAIGAKTLLVFPAKSQQEFPGGRFVPNQVFIGF